MDYLSFGSFIPPSPADFKSRRTLEKAEILNLALKFQEISAFGSFPWKVVSLERGSMVHTAPFTMFLAVTFPIWAIVFNLAAAKEEMNLDDNRSLGNLFDDQLEDFGPVFSPEDLMQICSTLYERVQRSNFNPWGGKRFAKAALRDIEKRDNNFNPWGGKRSQLLSRQAKNDLGMGEKNKPVFNPWGGR